MLTVSHENDELRVLAPSYTLVWPADRPFVYVEDAAGVRLAELLALSSVHTTAGQDDTVAVGAWEIDVSDDVVCVSLSASSSIWRSKRYTFECYPDRFRYGIALEGEAWITEVDYFGGYFSGQLRWGSGFFWSGQRFAGGFNPEPNTGEIQRFLPAEGAVIDLTGVPLPARGDWFFTPPPFCFAFESAGGWLAAGVEAPPGQNTFTEYRYHAQRGAFYLSLAYEGQTRVAGCHVLPAIGFDFAPSPYHALERHTAALVRHGCVSLPGAALRPAWWYSPIFCGWGAQCYAARTEHGHAPDYARQELYEAFLVALEQRDLAPGVVVLDDKWQATYGGNQVDQAKWPDLPGFIAAQHTAGRKVLLWLKAWDPEGVPAAECITNAAGLPVAVDPTHPAYEARLRAAVRTMLTEYGADGFKIDFTARIPSGPGLRRHGAAWGLELMRVYLAILYDEAKRAKPDALVITHTPHSYLADVVDMIRLNDINMGTDVNAAMTHRARIAAIACPNALIDTDNWPITDLATWRSYIQLQPDLGVPSLYCVTHIDTTGEPLTDADYGLIRQSQAAWRSRHGPGL